MKKQPNKICIVRLDRIGDVVLTLPLAAILKSYYPQSKITFLTKHYTKEIAENCKYVDRVISLNGTEASKEILSEIKKEFFDIIFIVSPNFPIAYTAFKARIPMRIGTSRRWYSFLFNSKVDDSRKEVSFHETEYNVRMLKPLGLDNAITKETVDYGIELSNGTKNIASKILAENGITADDRICIIHPGSGGSSVELPIEKYCALAKQISEKTHLKIVSTGSADEYDICQEVAQAGNGINLSGKLSLLNLMGVTEKSHIFISNSTGPLHVASALGKICIGFYPKVLVCSEKRWGPFSKNSFVFTPEQPCENCTLEECHKNNCMDTIEIDQVIKKIIELN